MGGGSFGKEGFLGLPPRAQVLYVQCGAPAHHADAAAPAPPLWRLLASALSHNLHPIYFIKSNKIHLAAELLYRAAAAAAM